MGIKRDRICPIQPLKFFRYSQGSKCSISAIHVEPKRMLTANVGYLRERINAACRHRSGAGDHGDGLFSVTNILFYGTAQFIGTHAKHVIDRSPLNASLTQAE